MKGRVWIFALVADVVVVMPEFQVDGSGMFILFTSLCGASKSGHVDGNMIGSVPNECQTVLSALFMNRSWNKGGPDAVTRSRRVDDLSIGKCSIFQIAPSRIQEKFV